MGGPKDPILLLATSNRGKAREIAAMLRGLPIELRSLADFPGLPEAVEDGATFEANARKKALHYARLTNLLTLADDSGLEVDALGGAPGVHSARYAGTPPNDAANNAKLLQELRDVPGTLRTARFQCVMALAEPGGVIAIATGTIEGQILESPRGHNGFGYDPLFFVSEMGKTTAELPPEIKNGISHRGKALAGMLSVIRGYVDLSGT